MVATLDTRTRRRLSRAIVIDDGGTLRRQLPNLLFDLGAHVDTRRPDVGVVVQSEADPAQQIAGVRRQWPSLPLLFIATSGSESVAIAAFRAGINEYLKWPVEPAEMQAAWSRLLPRARASAAETILLGESSAMHHARESVSRLAATSCNVLIIGETGTGKELAARLVHQGSDRRDRPFVSINCSAVPEGLFESEMFGFERGAFTGALAASAGRLREANGGTVFLDEVGELTLAVQPKLLRAIEQREIQPLGSRRHHAIDVRWVCATNRNLAQDCRDGHFRADLFYRLSVCPVTLPPLRDRREDIPTLAAFFAAELGRMYGRDGAAFTPAALAALQAHDWPGNVRELRNVVEHGLIHGQGPTIESSALPLPTCGQPRSSNLETLEKHRLIETLREVGGNKSLAAQRLRWSRMTLYRKLARFHIDVTGV